MFLTQFITLVLAFISRTVFIKTLGAEYLGLNGLFSSILTSMSLAEMGIGAAIAYALYKPIAEEDREVIKSILAFYRKCYFFIGVFIIAVGCLLIPFLPYLIKDDITIPVNIYSVYICFLANSVIGYFFAHKRMIIEETQNKYITASIDFIVNTIVTIAQIFIVWQLKDFMLFLYVKILGTIINYILVLIIADRKFPYIKEKAIALPSSVRKGIWSNVSILFFRKLGDVIVLGTDSIIISAFVGIETVGFYLNYTLIVSVVAIFCGLFITGADASIGNAIATLAKKELYAVFRKISFLIFCIGGVSAVCLVNLLNPFIELWIGKDYLLSDSVVYVIVANFFFMLNRNLVLVFRHNAGVFRPDMYKPFIEIVFTLSLSIFLVRIYGVLGVLIGILANTFCICVWIEAFIAHKHVFATSMSKYLKMYAVQALALLLSCGLSLYANSFVEAFIGKMAISILIAASVYFLVFFHTDEFKYFVDLVKKSHLSIKDSFKNKRI